MPNDRAEWTRDRLEQVETTLREAPLDGVLRWAVETFGPDVCLATSFGPQSIVLMHWISLLRPETTVFYLDTGLLFRETHALRNRLARQLGLEFTRVASDLTVEAQTRRHGPGLWTREPDRCCLLRKVEPLRRFLASKRAWVTGVRAAHSASRADARVVEWDDANGLVKLNPLAHWSHERVWEYLRAHGLPSNPLHQVGYPSIGCWPCTRAVRPGEDPRAGRWSGFEKTECGIHAGSGAQALRAGELRGHET